MNEDTKKVRFRRTRPEIPLAQITITLSRKIADMVDIYAREESMSRSQWIEKVLQRKMEGLGSGKI